MSRATYPEDMIAFLKEANGYRAYLCLCRECTWFNHQEDTSKLVLDNDRCVRNPDIPFHVVQNGTCNKWQAR